MRSRDSGRGAFDGLAFATSVSRAATWGLAALAGAAAVVGSGCGGQISSTDNGAGGNAGTAGHVGAGGAGAAGGATGGHTGAGGSATGSGGAAMNGCPLFTPDDAWNTDVSAKSADTAMTAKVQALLGNVNIHPDFGSTFGIPINVVPANQPAVPVTFETYPDESDPGPYPFPAAATAIIEGGVPANCSGDCHLLAVQLGTCQLYEGDACRYANGWICSNGAHWDLTKKSQGQRPDGWTSADAAGLPIYAGLARYAEYAAGAINHAIRFTLPCTANSRVAPATHQAVPSGCAGNANAPPMGLRMRLKASFDITGYTPTAQAFLRTFKKYGLILADNGGRSSTLFFQSEPNASWSDDEINDLKRVPVSAFEAVGP